MMKNKKNISIGQITFNIMTIGTITGMGIMIVKLKDLICSTTKALEDESKLFEKNDKEIKSLTEMSEKNMTLLETMMKDIKLGNIISNEQGLNTTIKEQIESKKTNRTRQKKNNLTVVKDTNEDKKIE